MYHHHQNSFPISINGAVQQTSSLHASSYSFFLSPSPHLISHPSPMGNVTSSAAGKVILSDGSVQEFNDSLTAAELMLEHPRQVVVEIRLAIAGKRPIPLPADEKLDMKKVYMMVPMRGGKPASLSMEEIRRVLVSANSALRLRSLFRSSSSKVLPWFARVCTAAAATTTRVAEVPIKKEDHIEIEGEEIGWETEMAAEGRPEYLSRQLSGRGWKPSLDTIKEKKFEKKFSHWLFNF